MSEHQPSAHSLDLPIELCPLLVQFSEVDSTNSVLSRMYADNPALPTYTVVTADHQTNGRGRLGRTWVDTPKESLLFSCLIRVTHQQLSWVTLLAGIALARVLRDHRPVLKWPNDVLINGRKVAGVLSEHVGQPCEGIHTVIVGVGVNFSQPSPQAGGEAGFVDMESVADCPLASKTSDEVFAEFLGTFKELLSSDDSTGGVINPVWQLEYMSLLDGIGRPKVLCGSDGSKTDVTLVGVDDKGALLVFDGVEEIVVTSGELIASTIATPSHVSPGGTSGNGSASKKKGSML